MIVHSSNLTKSNGLSLLFSGAVCAYLVPCGVLAHLFLGSEGRQQTLSAEQRGGKLHDAGKNSN